jgi:hypothetical protein
VLFAAALIVAVLAPRREQVEKAERGRDERSARRRTSHVTPA